MKVRLLHVPQPRSHTSEVECFAEIVKAELEANPGPPGKYYPFMSGKIKAESPLGQLLPSKGVKFYSTSAAAASAPSASSIMNNVAPGRFGIRSSRSYSTSSFSSPSRNYSTGVISDAARNEVLNAFAEHKACAVLRTFSAELAPKAMDAAIAGGFKVVEFTLTTPGCLDMVSDFTKRKDLMVGCGTVMNTDVSFCCGHYL